MTRALVLGSADTLQDDLAQCPKLDVIAVNDAGWKYPGPIRFWVTLHPENFDAINRRSGCGEWLKKRPRDGYKIVSHLPKPYVDIVYSKYSEDWCKGGSSGLLAVAFGLKHYNHLILAGMPMTPTPHFWGGKDWTERNCYWRSWEKAYPDIKGRVKSLSGATRELLGPPPETWLTDEEGGA